MTFAKITAFEPHLQEVSRFARVLSHPARLAILQYLAKCCSCKSGDISDVLPLSRTTVSQHLRELQAIGLIRHEVKGVTVCYSIDQERLMELKNGLDSFFDVGLHELTCGCKTPQNHENK
ncbi:MAG: metalloregulator ArsR/SmtB family transcription factor [Bacteroidales bacterium]